MLIEVANIYPKNTLRAETTTNLSKSMDLAQQVQGVLLELVKQEAIRNKVFVLKVYVSDYLNIYEKKYFEISIKDGDKVIKSLFFWEEPQNAVDTNLSYIQSCLDAQSLSEELKTIILGQNLLPNSRYLQ